MPETNVLSRTESLFPFERWDCELNRMAEEYRRNEPFPHIHLMNFLDAGVARQVLEEFPDTRSAQWLHYKHYNENKLGMTRRELFPATIGSLMDTLESPEFLNWLSVLTGIPDLIADSSLEGGGMHQSTRDGFLNIHADFTMHHHHLNWRRRINLILYLNQDWQPGWGGAIELWDASIQRCVVDIAPLWNHALIFNTDETSYHGFPEKLKCPPGITRKSLAVYYYTLEDDPTYIAKSTDYRARPEDSRKHSALIWLDKMAVHFYSRVKSRLGISDSLASRMLGIFNRRP